MQTEERKTVPSKPSEEKIVFTVKTFSKKFPIQLMESVFQSLEREFPEELKSDIEKEYTEGEITITSLDVWVALRTIHMQFLAFHEDFSYPKFSRPCVYTIPEIVQHLHGLLQEFLKTSPYPIIRSFDWEKDGKELLSYRDLLQVMSISFLEAATGKDFGTYFLKPLNIILQHLQESTKALAFKSFMNSFLSFNEREMEAFKGIFGGLPGEEASAEKLSLFLEEQVAPFLAANGTAALPKEILFELLREFKGEGTKN